MRFFTDRLGSLRICRWAGAPSLVAQVSGGGIDFVEERPDASIQLFARLPLVIRPPSGEAVAHVGAADPIHVPRSRLLRVDACPEGLTVDDQNNRFGWRPPNRLF